MRIQLLQQEIFQDLLIWYLKHIGGNKELVIHASESIFHHLLSLSCAEQDADRWIIPRLHLVLLIVGHIRVELAQVLMRKLLVLQFDDDAAMQYAVVEHQVRVVILVIDNNPFLASLKAEALAQFEDEILQMTDQRIFQVLFIHNFLRFQWLETQR